MIEFIRDFNEGLIERLSPQFQSFEALEKPILDRLPPRLFRPTFFAMLGGIAVGTALMAVAIDSLGWKAVLWAAVIILARWHFVAAAEYYARHGYGHYVREVAPRCKKRANTAVIWLIPVAIGSLATALPF